MQNLKDKLNSEIVYADINAILLVPVKITSIIFYKQNYNITAERYYKDDIYKNWDKKVSGEINDYIFNVNCASAMNELIVEKGGFSFFEATYKCSFYGLINNYDSKSKRLIQKHSLTSFNHFYSKKFKDKQIQAISQDYSFSWGTFCSGDIWHKKNTDEVYLGIKYTNPNIKNPSVPHYFLRTHNLWYKSIKDIKNSILELTGLNDVVFDKTGHIKDFLSIDKFLR